MPALVHRLDTLSVWRLPLDGRRVPARPSAAATDSTSRSFTIVVAADGDIEMALSGSGRALGTGDIAVVDDGEATAWITGSGAAVVARIPVAMAGPYAQALAEAHGRVIAGGSAISRIVSNLLREIAFDEDALGGRSSRLAQHIVGLVGILCSDGNCRDPKSELLASARDFIEEHLGDVDLSPDAIAAANNVSTRTLHRAFEADGSTIGGWIRARRLENCRVELADPQFAGVSVSSIGARWGLWDAAHFSRLFKATHGLGPSAYRERALTSVATHPRALDGGLARRA